MQEREIRRRAVAPEVVARREERQLLATTRRAIGDLQNKVAFALASVSTRQLPDHRERASEYRSIREEIERLQVEIRRLTGGEVGLGPAEDCRKALAILSRRVSEADL